MTLCKKCDIVYCMARKRRGDSVLLKFGLGALLLLFIYAVLNPSSTLSIVLVVLLIGVASYSLFTASKKAFEGIEKINEKSSRIEKAQNAYATHSVDYLTPTEFEHYVAAIFQKLGCNTTVTPPGNDEGIDVIATLNNETTGIQVKKWRGGVGRPDLQKLVGAGSKYDRIMCVTNSHFSKPGMEYAEMNNIILVDGEKLQDLAERAFGKDHMHKSLSMKIMGQYRTVN